MPPAELPPTPAGFQVDARAALRAADADQKVAAATAGPKRFETRVEARPEDGRWQVGYFDGDEEVAVVFVDPATGGVKESWTGHQVAWPMARGYEGQFGHALNAPYVWIPLAAIFLFGLLDWRRPWRLVHLDLLVLLSFALSHVFFNRGEIGMSVPLAYPPLLYLLARTLWIGFRAAAAGDRLRPSAPVAVLAVATGFLLVFRITLNIADSGVIDVGYAGVIGADRIAAGEPLYGEGAFPDDNPTGDTYGPASYFAYVPFELALPWSGEWDGLPAAHAAAIFFDLTTVAGLFFLGGRLRPAGGGELWPQGEGRALGVVLAFAWAAYPYTALALQSNSNDALVAAAIVWALVGFGSPWARGALLGVAALVKFAPLALVPLFAAGRRGLLDRLRPEGERRFRIESGLRPVVAFGATLALVTALLLAHPAIEPGLATFWERTIENQLDRESPFSVWGQEPSLGWLRAIPAAGAVGLALAVALVPSRRSLSRVAALAAATLIASQLAVEHWFYLYLPWFFALVVAAIAGVEDEPARTNEVRPG
ncbi:MAG: glycosyltransferase family 87 protein [Solirubrobacterales bacterium]